MPEWLGGRIGGEGEEGEGVGEREEGGKAGEGEGGQERERERTGENGRERERENAREERRGKRRREAVSGFCLNVGLCCVNKFKVEGAKLGVVVEGRRKALAVKSLISEGKLWHCMVAMTENLQILYPGMGSMALERAPEPLKPHSCYTVICCDPGR